VNEQNALTPAELRKLIDAAVDPWSMSIMLAAFTGARQAEVLGLQWGDIDCVEPQDRGDLAPVAPWRVLRAQAEGIATHGRAARRVRLGAQALAPALPEGRARPRLSECSGSTDGPMQSSDLLRTGLHPVLRRAGIRQVRFHDLRHAFASNL
jgi:integrase